MRKTDSIPGWAVNQSGSVRPGVRRHQYLFVPTRLRGAGKRGREASFSALVDITPLSVHHKK